MRRSRDPFPRGGADVPTAPGTRRARIPISYGGRDAPVGKTARLRAGAGRIPVRGRIVFRVHASSTLR